ncbi:MAG: tetratricopeptide repeat protein [Gammaproteobacteria bacterium]|nr:tetratricopeptide repeat protein [Gammaproteobacteria bacterium]
MIAATKLFVGCILVLGLLSCQVTPEPPPAPEPEAAPQPLTDVEPLQSEPVTLQPPVDSSRLDYQAALQQLKLGEDAAIAQLEKLSQETPGLEYIFSNLGIAYFNQNQYEQAEVAFERAISLNKDDAVAYNHMGILTRMRGEFQKSRQHYERAISIDDEYAAAQLNLGILFDIYIQDIKQALTQYRKYQTLTNNENKTVAGWIVDIERRLN